MTLKELGGAANCLRRLSFQLQDVFSEWKNDVVSSLIGTLAAGI